MNRKFKPGDRVVAVQDQLHYYKKGDVGTVAFRDKDGQLWVSFDDGQGCRQVTPRLPLYKDESIILETGREWCATGNVALLETPPMRPDIERELTDAAVCREMAHVSTGASRGIYLKAQEEHLDEAMRLACEPEPLVLEPCPHGAAPGEEE